MLEQTVVWQLGGLPIRPLVPYSSSPGWLSGFRKSLTRARRCMHNARVSPRWAARERDGLMMATLDLDQLRDDGDTIDLPDGRTLRLRIQPDDVNPFEDNPESYGRLARVEIWDRDGMRAGRPEGFDGAAEKLSIFNDVVWWQPPKDVKRSDPGFREFRNLIRDLASFGSHYVSLEVLDGTDAYNRPIVVNVAGLGGVDSLENGYLAEVVRDLADELEIG